MRAAAAGDVGPAAPRPRLHARARRGRSRDPRLGLALLSSVLVVNAGSTSLKLSLVAPDGSAAALDSLADVPGDVAAVAHRVVHGGAELREPTVIDDEVERRLAELTELAPLHNAPALAAIDEARRLFPDVPHVAVFDTAFHATIPEVASTYAVPQQWRAWGVRRYGFHGLSVQWSSERVGVPRLVVCHLGGGSSVTAVHEGASVDTTMGFSPLEGVPMATRSGSVDPSAILFLHRKHGLTGDELEHDLSFESGMKALAGSVDMRHVRGLALELFCYRVAGAVAAMTAALGGLDALVFTAGIGEHSARVRADICARLVHLGVELDEQANASARPDAEIGKAGARVSVWVIRAREELVTARAARELLGL